MKKLILILPLCACSSIPLGNSPLKNTIKNDSTYSFDTKTRLLQGYVYHHMTSKGVILFETPITIEVKEDENN